MKSKTLFEAFSYIDDQYLDMVDAPEKENMDMNKEQKHPIARKSFTFLIAAAICVSVLAMTAMAAGWIPNIFASVHANSEAEQEVLDAAAQVTQTFEPETVTIPEIDFTQITLFERYYDGETILLGYDLSKLMPEPVVGFQPEEALFKKITQMREFEHTPYPGKTDDTLELEVELGILTQEEYEQIMENRSEYAKQYNLHKDWQIIMDHKMQNVLTSEQYEQFWKILVETGSCCVALPSEPWVGDHIIINGHDNGEVIGPDCWSNRSDYTTDQGNCILLNPLPEAVIDQETVTVELSLRSGWDYWYMELEGDVYSCFESNTPYPAVFTIENVNN